jgi:miniconductance mechanosensitive channel
MKESLINWIKSFYTTNLEGINVFDSVAYENEIVYWTLGLVGLLGVSSFLIWLLSRMILISLMHAFVGKTKATWDDHLMHNKVFRGLALLVPLMFMEYFLSVAFFNYPEVLIYSTKFVSILLLGTIMIITNRVLNGFRDIVSEIELYRDKPIRSYAQVLKIIFSGILTIIILSVLTDKSPVFFLTSLGAVSAVLLLIFKDSILGFVGSVQLSSNDMIRIGDWVTMEKYGADGDVEEINLTTVKVRNFDRTITTIPTYSFISDSFINWRGMAESDGRRMKRSLNIQIQSVKFADQQLIDRIKGFEMLSSFYTQRQKEIDVYNEKNGLVGPHELFGRKQTNLGLFRRYIEFYLKQNNEINEEMTLMVRQLPSSDKGMPLEIYCFTKTKEWEAYEEVIADIFDHVFSVIGLFELAVFESPTGQDFKRVLK